MILESKNKKYIDIDEIEVSNKVSFGKKAFKYFISHRDAKKIRPLCAFLPKMRAYKKRLWWN